MLRLGDQWHVAAKMQGLVTQVTLTAIVHIVHHDSYHEVHDMLSKFNGFEINHVTLDSATETWR